MRIVVLALLLRLMGGCGGGASDTAAYQDAIDLANAKETEARMLGTDTRLTMADSGHFFNYDGAELPW